MLCLSKIILITIPLFYMQGEIVETMHFMVSPLGKMVCTFDGLLPCIKKITLLSDEEDRILEAHEAAPPSQPKFEHQQFNILQRSVETQGLARRRETVDAAPYSFPSMPEQHHGMYYTPQAFTQEPSQLSLESPHFVVVY